MLLISGGDSLDPNKRVCSYSAGTDTNPIFLFSRAVIDCVSAPPPHIEQAFQEGKGDYFCFHLSHFVLFNFPIHLHDKQ